MEGAKGAHVIDMHTARQPVTSGGVPAYADAVAAHGLDTDQCKRLQNIYTLSHLVIIFGQISTVGGLVEVATGHKFISVDWWVVLVGVAFVAYFALYAHVRFTRRSETDIAERPTTNPYEALLLHAVIVSLPVFFAQLLFWSSFQDERAALDDRDSHVEPVAAALDGRVHSAWNTIMMMTALSGVIILAHTLPLFLHGSIDRFAERYRMTYGVTVAQNTTATDIVQEHRASRGTRRRKRTTAPVKSNW